MAAIASGIFVGIVTGIGAYLFLGAAVWSSIHGGMSGMMLLLLSLIALAVPPTSGFLVGRAVYRQRPSGEQPHIADTIRLNCPQCGCSMNRSAEYSATPLYIVVECPIHGQFHFGPETNLTLGLPPPGSQ